MPVKVKAQNKPGYIVHENGDTISTHEGELIVRAFNRPEAIAIYAPGQWVRATTADGEGKVTAE